MKILFLSTSAFSIIVLAMSTTRRDKKLLEALLGEKDYHNDLALEQDMDPDLPPYPYQSSREEKKDALTLLQAKELIAKDQIFRLHFSAKAQDSGDDEGAA